MEQAKFVLSKKVLRKQIKILEDLKLKISYSYKTNKIVGGVIQSIPELSNIDFSIHAIQEIKDIRDKSRIWFFLQAQSEKEIEKIIDAGIRRYVIDNEVDLYDLLKAIENKKCEIYLLMRMKFQEHRIGASKYFVYGLPSDRILRMITEVSKNNHIKKLGIHLHRKSQNISEWEILEEIKDSFSQKTLDAIKMINIGGGLPVQYVNTKKEMFDYIFLKIKETQEWLEKRGIETIIEPGRFIAAPCIKLITKVIQKQGKNLIINTTLYNCALDSLLTETNMLIEGELDREDESGETFLIKGNSPTRDDIFRYNVRLPKEIDVGDEIIFLNAGAYNYTTDFFNYKKLKTKIKEDF